MSLPLYMCELSDPLQTHHLLRWCVPLLDSHSDTRLFSNPVHATTSYPGFPSLHSHCPHILASLASFQASSARLACLERFYSHCHMHGCPPPCKFLNFGNHSQITGWSPHLSGPMPLHVIPLILSEVRRLLGSSTILPRLHCLLGWLLLAHVPQS